MWVRHSLPGEGRGEGDPPDYWRWIVTDAMRRAVDTVCFHGSVTGITKPVRHIGRKHHRHAGTNLHDVVLPSDPGFSTALQNRDRFEVRV
jgi:hypothetical protein